jgi:predicted ATPase
LPRLLYVKGSAPDREPRLADLLTRIRDGSLASYRHFRTAAELGRLVRDDLALLLSERFGAAGGRAAGRAPTPAGVRSSGRLPASTTSLFGRERAIDEVAELVERPGVRLVTLTGPGGVGKTRLAVAVGERLRDRFGGGTVFVPVETVTDPGLVLTVIGRAAGEAPVPGTIAAGRSRRLCRRLGRRGRSLASGRTVRRPGARGAPRLHPHQRQRRRGGRDLAPPGGLPLAIELAAARTRLLDPATLLDRLAASLDALGTGAVDLPERQRTLRATVGWSVGLLEEAERSLLEVTAVFARRWTVQAAAQVAGLEEDRALGLSEALARHSLIYTDTTDLEPRSRMLETVREFVAERLTSRLDVAEIGRRHAGFYRALAEQADRPLRGAGQNEWLDRMLAESGNLAVAVRWYLAHDREPLPHLFRVLWLFWTRRDMEREARPWVKQLLPAVDTMDPQARAELACTAAVLAVDTGDETAALAARERIAQLLAGIQDPFLHAVTQLAMAWILPIAGDVDGALREVAASLEELRGQDEPVFTAIAAFGADSLETALDRHDDASRHLREARDLAERYGADWLAAGCRAMLGILAVLRHSLDQARTLLDQALDLSLAARSTRS